MPLLLIGRVAPTWTGVESQVRDLGGGPLQLSQDHGTHLAALLVGLLGSGAAPAPQVDAAVQDVLGGWRKQKQSDGATQEKQRSRWLFDSVLTESNSDKYFSWII